MARNLAVITLTCLFAAGCSGPSAARGERAAAVEVDNRLYSVRVWDGYAVVEPAPEDQGPVSEAAMLSAVVSATGCRVAESSYIDRFMLAASLACDSPVRPNQPRRVAALTVSAPPAAEPACPPPHVAASDPAHMIRIEPAAIDQLLAEAWRITGAPPGMVGR